MMSQCGQGASQQQLQTVAVLQVNVASNAALSAGMCFRTTVQGLCYYHQGQSASQLTWMQLGRQSSSLVVEAGRP